MLTPLLEIVGHQSTITAIAIMEEMNYLISADDFRVIKCWQLFDRTCLQTHKLDAIANITQIVIVRETGFVTVSNRLHLFNFSAINYFLLTQVRKGYKARTDDEHFLPIY